MVNVDNANEILKNYYIDAINKQLSGDVSPFYNAIQKSSENIVGKEVWATVAYGTLSGVAALGESDDLPTPREDNYFTIALDLKNIYGTIELSDKAIRASAHSAGPFINLLNAETEGLVKSAKANLARMLYGDGNGTLCEIVSKKAKTEIYVNNAKSYMAGLKVEVCLSDRTINTIISSVKAEEGIIGLGIDLDSYTVSGGEKIRLKGAYDNELMGLAAIFDSPNLYGQFKMNNFINTYERTRTLDSLTEADLIEVLDILEERGDGKPNMILCSHKTRNKIALLTSNSRRIVNSMDIAAGYSSIYVNEVPVYADKFCPEDRIYILNTDDFVLSQLCDWSWIEGENGKILRQIPGKAAYSATLVMYAQLFCKNPYAQGLIRLSN